MYNGKGVSPGVAIGEAYVLQLHVHEHSEFQYIAEEPLTEWRRLLQAISISAKQIQRIQQENRFLKASEMKIMDAHLSILEDPMIKSELKERIRDKRLSALQSVKQVMYLFEQMFESLDDEYMRERVHDVRDVSNRIVKNLLGQSFDVLPDDKPYILVAHEIPPSLSAQLNPNFVEAIVTTIGSQTSHVSIVARSLGIPYVAGMDDATVGSIQDGDVLAVDGDGGLVSINPSGEEREGWRHRELMWRKYMAKLSRLRNVKATTIDGVTVSLLANLNKLSDAAAVLTQETSGVGLFRSEYLFMDRPFPPDEQEQFEVYKQLAESFTGRPVVIRTIDIGGDKSTPCLPLPDEENPFLGLRAIRFSLAYPEFLRVQLRAILRASEFGEIRVLLPMVTSLEEVIEFKGILRQVHAELQSEGNPLVRSPKLGAMIEVPAAALIVDQLATELDFISIGTNDLAQYTLAADRLNELVAHVYDPFHPALIRLLAYICRSAEEAGLPVSVCGEMAGDTNAVPLWLALGVRELSMSAARLLPVKEIILQKRARSCNLDALLKCKTTAEVKQILEND